MVKLRISRDRGNVRVIRKNVELDKLIVGHKKILKAIGDL